MKTKKIDFYAIISKINKARLDKMDKLLLNCKYNEFMALSKTSKDFYRIARTIWKKWLGVKFNRVLSFVNENDYYKLLKILSQIKSGTLKDNVSVLIVYGTYCSGKSTLINIFKGICSSVGYVSTQYPPKYPTDLSGFLNRIVCIDEFEKIDKETKMANILHRDINLGITYRKLHEAHHTGINNPGTVIFKSNCLFPDVKITGNEGRWSRTTPIEEMQFGFQLWPVKYLDIYTKKYPRYPLYLHLPHKFEKNDGTIIEDCINELNNNL